MQIGAVDQPHGDVQPAVDLAYVVDGYDVAVIEAGGRADLAAETLLELVVFAQVRQQHLERDDAVDLGVVGAPDLAHPAATQQFEQPVATEWRAFHGAHDNRRIVGCVTRSRAHPRRSARRVENLDREDERVAGQDSCGGLTVGVAVGRGHRHRDRRSDLLARNGLLEARHDAVQREFLG